MPEICSMHRGTSALLISLPHDGHWIPDDIAARMRPAARVAPDTDWHVARVYAFARDLGASMIVPFYSRYVVDLNRPPDDVSLYPGQNTTGLCPATQFSGEPIYRIDEEPTPAEIAERIRRYWRPYHDALTTELKRLKGEHGRVLLWEGHSIRGECPWLFGGRLPDLNVGTADGRSCSPPLQSRIEAVLAAQTDYTWVVNGRFKGGYITRHYGDPANGIDAVQLEIAQRTYMDEDGGEWQEHAALRLRSTLERLLLTGLDSAGSP